MREMVSIDSTSKMLKNTTIKWDASEMLWAQ